MGRGELGVLARVQLPRLVASPQAPGGASESAVVESPLTKQECSSQVFILVVHCAGGPELLRHVGAQQRDLQLGVELRKYVSNAGIRGPSRFRQPREKADEALANSLPGYVGPPP